MARLALGWNAPRQPLLGMVLSGEVDAVGPDATSFGVGQPVFGFNRHRFGTYAHYLCWPEDGPLATRPANLTNDEAAAIPYGGLGCWPIPIRRGCYACGTMEGGGGFLRGF